MEVLTKNGISYTEKEYDYAKDKGIPVLAFLHSDIQMLPANKFDGDVALREKLDAFRIKVQANRLVKYWNNGDDLNGKVAISLIQTIKTYPAIGWIRGDIQTNLETLQELNTLRKEIEKLRNEKHIADTDKSLLGEDITQKLIDLDTDFSVKGYYKHYDYQKHQDVKKDWRATICMRYILENLGIALIDNSLTDTSVRNKIEKSIYNREYPENDISAQYIHIDTETYQKIKLYLRLSGLIKIEQKDAQHIWSLSNEGRMYILHKLCMLKSDKVK